MIDENGTCWRVCLLYGKFTRRALLRVIGTEEEQLQRGKLIRL